LNSTNDEALHYVMFCNYFSSSAYEVRPVNDLLRPHYCIRQVISLMIVQVFFR